MATVFFSKRTMHDRVSIYIHTYIGIYIYTHLFRLVVYWQRLWIIRDEPQQQLITKINEYFFSICHSFIAF